MQRREFLRRIGGTTIALAAHGWLGHLFAQATARPAGKPNILVIVSDDMGYADVGFHGCTDIPTPNLDALAAAGVRFSNAYVTAPYCSPSRAGLMTGRYQTRFGHEFNPGANHGLPLTETTLADRLKAAGYATGAVGKWHLGAHPQKRGFDEFFGFLAGATEYVNCGEILRGTKPVPNPDYTTDIFGREAAAFIERHKSEPWFLYLAFNAVHTPMQATDDRLAKFAGVSDKKRRTYAAMLLAMDENIGLVRKTLAGTGLDRNTLIVFVNDNGGPRMRSTTINGSSNHPLRGSKRTTLEGGIRVPVVMTWPDRLKPATYNMPVISLDLTATALAAAGIDASPEWKIEGANLLPYLAGEKQGTPHDALYWRFGNQMAIRSGDWKLVRYDQNADTNTGKEQQRVTTPKLYNLAEDIGESKDLAAVHPDKAKELQSLWNEWNKHNIPPLWGGDRTGGDGAEPGAPGGNAKEHKP